MAKRSRFTVNVRPVVPSVLSERPPKNSAHTVPSFSGPLFLCRLPDAMQFLDGFLFVFLELFPVYHERDAVRAGGAVGRDADPAPIERQAKRTGRDHEQN